MRYRRLLLAATAVLPAAGVVGLAGTASAAGTPTGVGTLTCAVSGDATFTPPLTATGTPGYRDEIIHFDLQASSCSGPSSNRPQPNPTSASVTSRPIKLKDAKMGKTKVAGACGSNQFPQSLTLKSTESWAGTTVKTTKTIFKHLTGSGDDTLSSGGGSSRSYEGTASISLAISSSEASEIGAVCQSGGSGSISEIDFESASSTLTVGTQLTS